MKGDDVFRTVYEMQVESDAPPDPDLSETEIIEFAHANGADITRLSTDTVGEPDGSPLRLSGGAPLGVSATGELLEGTRETPVRGEGSYWVTITQQKTYRVGADSQWEAGDSALALFSSDDDLHAAVTNVAPA